MSLLWDVNNDKFVSLWDILDRCGTMADGSFLRGHGRNLHHIQIECLGLLSIWNRHLYLGISLFGDIYNAKMGYLNQINSIL